MILFFLALQSVASVSDENNEPKRITNNGKMMIIATKSTDTKIKMKRIKIEERKRKKERQRERERKKNEAQTIAWKI